MIKKKNVGRPRSSHSHLDGHQHIKALASSIAELRRTPFVPFNVNDQHTIVCGGTRVELPKKFFSGTAKKRSRRRKRRCD